MFETEDPIDVYLGEDGRVHLAEPGASTYLCGAPNLRPDERLQGRGTIPIPGCVGCYRGTEGDLTVRRATVAPAGAGVIRERASVPYAGVIERGWPGHNIRPQPYVVPAKKASVIFGSPEGINGELPYRLPRPLGEPRGGSPCGTGGLCAGPTLAGMTTTAGAVTEELRRELPVRVSDRRVELLAVLAQGWHLLGRNRLLFDEAIRVDDGELRVDVSQPGPELDDEEYGTVQHMVRRYGGLSERDLTAVLSSLAASAGAEVSVMSLRDWLADDDEFQRAAMVERDIRKSGVFSLRSLAVPS